MISANGQVTRREVMKKLNVSDNTANRLLQELEAKKLILRKGEGRGSYYIPG